MLGLGWKARCLTKRFLVVTGATGALLYGTWKWYSMESSAISRLKADTTKPPYLNRENTPGPQDPNQILEGSLFDVQGSLIAKACRAPVGNENISLCYNNSNRIFVLPATDTMSRSTVTNFTCLLTRGVGRIKPCRHMVYDSAKGEFVKHCAYKPNTEHPEGVEGVADHESFADVPQKCQVCHKFHDLRLAHMGIYEVPDLVHKDKAVETSDFRLIDFLCPSNLYLILADGDGSDMMAMNKNQEYIKALQFGDPEKVMNQIGPSKTWEVKFIRQPDGTISAKRDGPALNMVFLWPQETETPQNTVYWLSKWEKVVAHYHAHVPQLENDCKIDDIIAKQNDRSVADLCRLGRTFSGCGIGLVLGGGGARGAAHVGVLEQLAKHNVPIDFIGGNSMGSFMSAAFVVSDGDISKVENYARSFFGKMIWWKTAPNTRLPFLSLNTGRTFDDALYAAVQNKRIEDQWIPYFSISTNLTKGIYRLHRSGYLWRYCRASMSIAGLVPPVHDADGDILLDGGYLHNLPVDAMFKLGAGYVIGVDVGDHSTPKDINSYNMLMRLSFLSDIPLRPFRDGREWCIRPQIEAYSLVDFGKYEKIREKGNDPKLIEKVIKDFSDRQIVPKSVENDVD